MQRQIAGRSIPVMGLGCMNVSHAYGHPPSEGDAIRLLQTAYDLGVRHFDTAALYGFGANETLVGKALKDVRQDIFLASKCVMTGVDGKRVINGRPESLIATLDEALGRLQTDHIDLYYLHRWDKNVPIEDSVGALARMVEAGKIGAIGLSEMSVETIKKAECVHSIAALQTEYSLWSRNAEIAVLDYCREQGIAFVAFSPLARGFLSDGLGDINGLAEKDIRRGMPRFQEPNYSENLKLLQQFKILAAEAGCTPGQLALKWVLEQGDHVLPIPGTRRIDHLKENLLAVEASIAPSILSAAGDLINQHTVHGPRYPAGTQAEIDTEEFV